MFLTYILIYFLITFDPYPRTDQLSLALLHLISEIWRSKGRLFLKLIVQLRNHQLNSSLSSQSNYEKLHSKASHHSQS